LSSQILGVGFRVRESERSRLVRQAQDHCRAAFLKEAVRRPDLIEAWSDQMKIAVDFFAKADMATLKRFKFDVLEVANQSSLNG